MTLNQSYDVIVIGAGIIGVSSALQLQANGKRVLLVDKKGIAQETSAGNAGAFAFADVVPLATPGIMLKAPKWLLDPLGPLSLRPAYLLNILPWLYKFWRASWPRNYQAALTAQANLMKFSQAALERQIQLVKGESMMRREGQLQLYEGASEFRASLAGWQTRKEYGVKFELLESCDAIAKIQPGLHKRFTHAGYTPDWMNVTDPKAWTNYLANAFEKFGGQLKVANVSTIKLLGNGVSVSIDDRLIKAEQLVVAAGAWSKTLAKALGDQVPLETERGYNTTLPAEDFQLKTHLSFSNHGFVVSKIGESIRVGGAVELGGLKLVPNYKRAEALLNKAKDFIPQLNNQGGEQWMGYRPSMPDSLPVISYAKNTNQVVYAFGHGHLGLTQAAGTAELVRQLLMGQTPVINVAPYSVKRF
ncbi:FAD-dependent oxidoreductase [Reinekea marina]|uniref:NAD(P)/FAD-dependent oxidoreductase n=1 Tax=Reinekea marina TaxID=1310421 RepID=A0ABV7WN54_9GAMM|nr:FAD-dependent oxidoreductase [Reinekea marina]MDN3648483.1 FAD-dependent oxidoreductase [Reinekea marina]